MKNITVSIDDESYRQARIRAATLGRSVSSLVKEMLVNYAAPTSEDAARRSQLDTLFDAVDRRLKGVAAEPERRNWRNKMYDERFDETILGRALLEREI